MVYGTVEDGILWNSIEECKVTVYFKVVDNVEGKSGRSLDNRFIRHLLICECDGYEGRSRLKKKEVFRLQ